MPLGKYYCDYCDKEFQDTPSARKRHLQGLHHLRAKALWYDSLNNQESTQAFTEGFVKGVCNRFVKTGFCQYGDSCRFFHPKNLASLNLNTQHAPDNQQLRASARRFSVPGASLQGDVVTDNMGMAWANLPPSLKPPPEGGYPPMPTVDWG